MKTSPSNILQCSANIIIPFPHAPSRLFALHVSICLPLLLGYGFLRWAIVPEENALDARRDGLIVQDGEQDRGADVTW